MPIKTRLPIEFSCTHTETVDLSHIPAGRRKAYAFGLGKHRVCTRCFKAAGAADLEQRNRQTLLDAEQFAQEHQLPELTGSEKQIAWATRVRYQALTDILDTDEATGRRVLAAAMDLTRSGWWLDNCTDTDLDVEDLTELILTADESDQSAPIETENPF